MTFLQTAHKLHTESLLITCIGSLLAVTAYPYLQEDYKQMEKTRERQQMGRREQASNTETGKKLYIPAH